MYASLKAELLDHLSGINADYPLVVLSDVKKQGDAKATKAVEDYPAEG